MPRFVHYGMLALLIAGILGGSPALAQNKGQEDLDKATEAKLTASKMSDLAEVIRLCESALAKGLDEENTKFAKQLLASTLIQRGAILAKTINRSPIDARWLPLRKLALADLEKAVGLDPKQPQALYLIGRLNLLPGGNVERATEVINKVIKMDDHEPELRAKALTLRAGLQKDAKAKLADLDEAVRISPRDAAALRTRGLAHADMEKPEKALADFQAAIKLDPKHVPTFEAQALVLAGMKKYDEALVCVDQIRQLKPDSVAPLILRARIHALQSNLKAAVHDLNQAANVHPDNVAVRLLRAEVHQELGQSDKALADVDKALELRPGLPTARRFKAVLLANAGKLDLATDELRELLKTDPDDFRGRLQLAMFYSAQKKPLKAIETYSAVLADHPDDVTGLRGRADALLGIGKHAEAIADYEKALKLQPKDTGILNNLAWVLATSPKEKLRDGKRAITLATEACKLTDYKKAHILSTLAAAFAETGDFKSAVKWSEKAVELGAEDQKDVLVKELESYRAGKPWRELLSPEEPEKKEEKKP